MAASKEESVISLSIDEDIDKTNDSSHNNQNISDFEGKVILESSIERNGPLGITEESTAGVCYMFQQNEKKITEKREDVFNVITQASTSVDQTTSPNERNISTAESCSDESRKAYTYKEEASLNQSTKLLCELCSTDEEHVEATHFCKTCDDPDPLCGMCAKHHLKQKLSKNHEMCEDLNQFPNKKKTESLNQSTKLLCELCSTDEENVEATHFCKTCDEPDPLCGICAKHHLRQKFSKNHEMCADIEQFPNKRKTESLNLSTKLLCELCCTDEEHVEATHFCKTCNDPDPLCGMCAKHHLRQKLSKNHEMCANIEEFPNKEKTECSREGTETKKTQSKYFPSKENNYDREEMCSSKDESFNTENEKFKNHEEKKYESKALNARENDMGKKMLCEPCSYEGSKIQSTHFCETCDDPEPFCDACAKNHTKQKISKHHKLSKNMQDFTKRENVMEKNILCEPCSSEGLQVQASHFCETCDDPEPLCNVCAKNHTKQKISKHHRLSKNIQDFKEREKANMEMLFCEPCFSENLQIQATHFCKTCDDPEPLCDSCAKYHTKQKLSKNHELSGDIREFQKM